MLIGIPPILGPELLATLRAMGHGDEIAVVDGNYPALEHARQVILSVRGFELDRSKHWILIAMDAHDGSKAD